VVKLKAEEGDDEKIPDGEEDKSTQHTDQLSEITLKKKKSSKRDSIRIDDEKNKQDLDKIQKGGLVKIEEKSEGAIPMKIYYTYISGGGFLITLLVIIGFSGATTSRVLCDWWLGQWSSKVFFKELEPNVGVYIALAVITGLLLFMRAILFGLFSLRTANELQRKLLTVLLKSPLSNLKFYF
jgi:uncharacterized integral membrane protein